MSQINTTQKIEQILNRVWNHECTDGTAVTMILQIMESDRKKITELMNALKPLAELDLRGVTGDIVYQRNQTIIYKKDVLKAIEILSKSTN